MYSLNIIGNNGNMTQYMPKDLARMARSAVKGKGKLTAYWITVNANGNVRLCAQYLMRDGWSQTAELPVINTLI